MKCQKLLSKAIKKIDKALSTYSKSTFADSTAITNMAVARKDLFMLKEDIKIRTFERLPYSDLNEERKTDEKEIVGVYRSISLKQKLVIGIVLMNAVGYLVGFILGDIGTIGASIFLSMILGLAGFLWWTKPGQKKKST